MRDTLERGFTLIDLLVGTAVAVLIGAALIAAAHAFAGWSALAAGTVDAQAAVDTLAERWNAAAAGAWAIFVPADDVLGKPNADGHEFDIATEDDRRRPSYRAYIYDASSQRLNVYVYGTAGATPSATGESVGDVTAFQARTQPPSTLQNAGDAFYDPLFAKSTIADADVDVGLGAQAPGGNRLTRVHVVVGRVERDATLASGTAPSSFTVIVTYTPSPT